MPRIIWRNIVLCAVLLMCQYPLSAQQQNNSDSLLICLKGIRSKADSGLARRAVYWIARSTDEELVKVGVANEIDRLGKDPAHIDLNAAYLIRLVNLNTATSNTKAIEIGKTLPQQVLAGGTEYVHTTRLYMFREVRNAYRNMGRFNDMLQFYGQWEKDFSKANDSLAVSIANNVLSGAYFRMGILERAVYHMGKSTAYLNERNYDLRATPANILFGVAGKLNRFSVLSSYFLRYEKLKEADSCINEAMYYYNKLDDRSLHLDIPYLFLQKAISRSLSGDASSQLVFDTCYTSMLAYNPPKFAWAVYYQERASDLIRLGQLDSALVLLRKVHGLVDSFQLGIIHTWGDIIPEYEEARIATIRGDINGAITLLQRQIAKLEPLNLRSLQIKTYEALARAYETKGNTAEAYRSIKRAFELSGELARDEKEARTLSFETERKIQENETAIQLLNARDEGNKKIRFYLIGIIALLVLLALGLAYFYRNKKKTGEILASKNHKLEQALQELRATQQQLIQSEKMASLGELTAGIAHEIQNPLNFVNNFSEINTELTDEISEALDKDDKQTAKELVNDIRENQQRINEHGKRAEAIVRGMLQHSRTGTGNAEPTDINALADEYLRLAFHGFRAKDKSFNASFITEFDPSIGNVNIVPQDIGRVLLNLVNNAFYAVNEKARSAQGTYEPTVTIKTQKKGQQLEIRVSDNGNGIPQNIQQKIFQPFFTTKPTGQGTGLGLSLSYDIVKAHGGELKVESREGEGTTFTVEIPFH